MGGDGALSRPIRDVSSAVKKARLFETRKVLRKLKELREGRGRRRTREDLARLDDAARAAIEARQRKLPDEARLLKRLLLERHAAHGDRCHVERSINLKDRSHN